MQTIAVYDKPMCCSTGVCGPDVDPVLPRFAADLEWLKSRGYEVRRYNLAQDPASFMEHPSVKQVIDRTGGEGLPVILVNDQVVSEGTYPTRGELVRWMEVKERPAQMMRQLAQRLLSNKTSEAASGCCGGASDGCR
jgi:arsenite methyltransferase